MFQGDPTVRESYRASVSEKLGMEARSILRSIQTETAKLEHSTFVARSDLHYFRARFNYYRLSLMRLLPPEREHLEPVLSQFMELIAAKESETQEVFSSPTLESSTPPFLESISDKSNRREPQREIQKVLSYREEPVATTSNIPHSQKEELVSELSLLRMALQAEATNQGNRHIARALDRILDRLSKN